LAPVKRGLKRGLKGRIRTVLLMLDETIITETPPLYSCYGHIGEQVRVPITGNRSKRILHGAINVRSGDVSLLIEDRASQHTSPDSRGWAEHLGIEVRLLPRATPELNAMDDLWRQTKRETVGSRATSTVARSALDACRYIIDLSPHERLRQAGVLSGNFWLTGLLPVSWSSDNGNHGCGCSVEEGVVRFSSIGTYLAHVVANSAGVLYPNELCGRSVLYSSFQSTPRALACASLSNSSRSRNSSRSLLWNDSAYPFCQGLPGAT
jgi:hypothetical protein